ncbi:MAG: hypothetical protein KJ949_00380 [Nanoarchaeota archaeon]|nr:hypothetical protein [Nanoarchaeota archaeon]
MIKPTKMEMYTLKDMQEYAKLIGDIKYWKGALDYVSFNKIEEHLIFNAETTLMAIKSCKENVPDELIEQSDLKINKLEIECSNILRKK